MKPTIRRGARCVGVLACGLLLTTMAGATPPRVDAQGTAYVPGFSVPFSSYASPEARRLFQRVLVENRDAPPLLGPIAASRAYWNRINTARAARMEHIYPVTVVKRVIAGVPTQIVTPRAGVAPAETHRVLINLHGGAFMWGAGSGGLVESIPVAGVGGFRVITVDYREGPEHVFPAASEDVAKVYRVLLKRYSAKSIGIYGCSAGGFLTAESVAWLIHDKLPVPGAIGTYCGSVAKLGGDSLYVAPSLQGDLPVGGKLTDLPYFKGARASDPLVFPGDAPALLAKFPPTLLISGTRDPLMSEEVQSQRLLTDAGVDAELHIWDGMWHSFFSDPDMPESKEAYAVMVRFFNANLGR